MDAKHYSEEGCQDCVENHAQLQLVSMVLQYTGYACYAPDAKDRDAAVKKFSNEWGDAILDCLNDHRQYVKRQAQRQQIVSKLQIFQLRALSLRARQADLWSSPVGARL